MRLHNRVRSAAFSEGRLPLEELWRACPQGMTSRTPIPHIFAPSTPSHTETSARLSPSAVDLLQRLLVQSGRERLGQSPGGADDLRSHPFFAGLPL